MVFTAPIPAQDLIILNKTKQYLVTNTAGMGLFTGPENGWEIY